MRWGPLAWVLLGACVQQKERPAESLRSLAPTPLAPLLPSAADAGAADLGREAAHRIAVAEVYGAPVPKDALVLELGDSGRVSTPEGPLQPELAAEAQRLKAMVAGKPVHLSAKPGVFLAQAAAALAVLDDAGAQLTLAHPSGKVAFPLALRDEEGFRAWLDEPKPGKVRVVQRQDGFELQSNVGKLPGVDPNGPSVPRRGGQLDLATLREGLGRLKGRFKTAADLCYLPSFGTDVAEVALAMAANYAGPDEAIFPELCLVYPRPAARDR